MTSPLTRRYDLDWLRIFAVFLLVPFHSALIFALGPQYVVYIKDSVESRELIAFASFVNLWHMPLLFIIAGASTWFALGKRSPSQYLIERVLRLLIPAVFGIVALIPLMTYTHYLRSSNPPNFCQYYLGFFHINPDDLTGVHGSFTPAHLWFIVFLFIFSLVGLPVFVWLRGKQGSNFVSWFGRVFSMRGMLILLFIPLLAAAAVPILGDKNPLYYFLCFFLGCLLIADDRIQKSIDRDWPVYAGLAILGTITYFVLDAMPVNHYQTRSNLWLIIGVVFVLTRWVWVIAILGAGQRWLNRSNPILPYCNEAAFPFYILHLPMNTLVGLVIIHTGLSIGLKYALIVLITTLLTWLIYELIVRRIGVLRFLFGVKKKRKSASKEQMVPAPAN